MGQRNFAHRGRLSGGGRIGPVAPLFLVGGGLGRRGGLTFGGLGCKKPASQQGTNDRQPEGAKTGQLHRREKTTLKLDCMGIKLPPSPSRSPKFYCGANHAIQSNFFNLKPLKFSSF